MLTVEATQLPDSDLDYATQRGIEVQHDQFETFLAAIDHPDAKRGKVQRRFRRELGRAPPTDQEP